MRGIKKDSEYYKEFHHFAEKLSAKIIRLRKEQGITQEQMEQFEISLRQFQRIESGKTVNITLSNLYKIAQAFGLKLHELLDV